MDVLDRLQSGLFFQANVLDFTPTIFQPQVSYNSAQPTVNYLDNASSGIPFPPPPSINTAPAPEVPLPLLSVSVDVDVHGRFCTTKVTQQFSNARSSTSQNVKYVFPIYDGSIVTSFRCWIGNDKLLEGAVKAKEAARADFKHAVSQRKVAVLVEELTPEVFETTVGNIPAQTTVKVEITYANLLKVDNSTGGLVLTIPTSIAPRYGILPPGYDGNQSLLTEGLRINVQVSMPAAIRKMESRSHPISVEMGAVSHKSFKNFAAGASSDTVDYSKGRATLSDRRSFLHQDFVLHILCSSREPLQSRAIAVTQPGQPALSTIAVTLHPLDLFRQNVNVGDFGGEIIFMADRSGSMKSKIPSLINVMNIFLRSLPEACSFNIASFGTNVTWLWPSSRRYSQENLDVASKHVDSFLANYGGTEIYRALHSVLDHYNKHNDVPTNVILLTDGEVWDVDRVIQLVRGTVSDHGSNIRFFSLGIGDRVSHRLVEGIGQQGGGYAEVVPESSMGSWQERVIQMLKAALTPSRLQCSIDLGKDLAMKTSEREIAGYKVQYPQWVQTPHHLPVLNTFSHSSVYYMLESGLDSLPKTISITATTDKGERLTAELPIQMIADQSAIHHLAAKALMNDYETGQSWLHSLNPDLKSSNATGFEDILRHEAEELGQRWSIPSRWTSYVAIDRATAQHHAISVQKADAIEVSQLTRQRNIATLPPALIPFSGRNMVAPNPEACLGHRASRDPVRGVRLGAPPSLPAPAGNSSSSRGIPALRLCPPPLPEPPRRGDPPPSSAVYIPSDKTWGPGVGLQQFWHDESPRSSPAQPKSQDEEVRFEAAKPPQHLKTWSSSIGAEGDKTPDEDKDTKLPSDLNSNAEKAPAEGFLGRYGNVSYESHRKFDRDSSTVAYKRIGVIDFDCAEESQTQLRRLSTTEGRTATRGRPSSDVDRRYYESPSSSIDEAQLMRNTSSNDREVRHPNHTPLSEFPSLETILREQEADGKFTFLSRSFRIFLTQYYNTNALQEFLTSRFGRRSDATRSRLIDTILTVVYITDLHATSKALWELQVAKAQQWIKRTITELFQESGNAEDTPEVSLEELVDSILGEMEKLVLLET